MAGVAQGLPAEDALGVYIESMSMSSSEVIEISTALLTPLIAVLALYIAYQQFKINQGRLKREEYQRKVAMYGFFKEYISAIIRNGTIADRECIDFYHNTAECDFLFGQELIDYREKIYEKGIDLAMHSDTISRTGSPRPKGEDEKRAEAIKRKKELFSWFSKQPTEIRRLFAKEINASL